MASRCKLCGKTKKSSQPQTMWRNETDGTTYEVHAACKAWHTKTNAHLWDYTTMRIKKS